MSAWPRASRPRGCPGRAARTRSRLLRSIGGSLGAAALGAVYTARLTASLGARLGPAEAGRLTGGGGLTPASLAGLPPAVRDAVGTAVTSGLHGTVAGGVALAAVATAVACLGRPDPAPEPQEGAAPAAEQTAVPN
ncbi:hypothetical protein [Kitasatospora aureofaciens]|uniref:hypothetical protein n=1 Tax=Kitasatospora aureofaciens TaxID=1894 RepID=UPI0036F46FBB